MIRRGWSALMYSSMKPVLSASLSVRALVSIYKRSISSEMPFQTPLSSEGITFDVGRFGLTLVGCSQENTNNERRNNNFNIEPPYC